MTRIIFTTILIIVTTCTGFSQNRKQLRLLAAQAWQNGDYKLGIEYSEQQLPLTKAEFGEFSKEYANNLGVLAYFHVESYLFDKAAYYYKLAIPIDAKIYGEEDITYANSLYNIGLCYRRMNQFDQAEIYVEKAFHLLEKILDHNSFEYVFQLASIGNFYGELAQYDKALDLLYKSGDLTLQLFGQDNDRFINCALDIGEIYVKLDSNSKAENFFLAAEEGNIKLYGDPYTSDSLQHGRALCVLGTFYLKQGKLLEAEPRLIRAEVLAKEYYGPNSSEYSDVCNALADMYVKKGDLKEANRYLMKLLYILKQSNGDIGILYGRGVYKVAEVDEKKKNIVMAMIDLKWSISIYMDHLNQQSGFLSEVEFSKYLENEKEQKNLYFSLYHRNYQSEDGKKTSGRMFDFLAYCNGLQLRSSSKLKKIIYNSNDSLLIVKYNNWNLLKTQIAHQYSIPVSNRSKDLPVWEENANTIEKEITRQTNQIDTIQNPVGAYTRLRKKLMSDQVAIEFVSFQYHNGISWTDSTIYAALVMRSIDSFPIYIPLFEERQLKGLFKGDSIRTFANLLYTNAQIRSVEHDVSYGDSLYRLIWKPILPCLDKYTQITYSPSGLLHNLTFDAIPVNDEKVLSDVYKLERMTSTAKIDNQISSSFQPSSISLFGGLQYTMKASELKKTKRKHITKQDDSFGYSNTRGSNDSLSRGGSWCYLPGTKTEVLNIEKSLKSEGLSMNVYTDMMGTESTIKDIDPKNSPSVIHFSTHGYFFPDPVIKKEALNKVAYTNESVFEFSDNPLFRSGLLMAGANYVWEGSKPIDGIEDGILTAYEVSNLYLPNTKLVVMSACETGLGDIKGSEGVYGLQRSFKIAGVDYIIMTLWQVLDKETSDFMTLFYQKLLEKKSVPVAFKITQDEMKNKYRDEPYKWAGFVLVK